MCRAKGRRCPNSKHGAYNPSKASVAAYKKASARLANQIKVAHTLTTLKEEQARLRDSGDTEALQAHIAEHGSQQALSKKLGNTRTSIANKEKRLKEHFFRTDPETDRQELEPLYDEDGRHIQTGILAHAYSSMEFAPSDGPAFIPPTPPTTVSPDAEAREEMLRAAKSAGTPVEEMMKLAEVDDSEVSSNLMSNPQFPRGMSTPEQARTFKMVWGRLTNADKSALELSSQSRWGWGVDDEEAANYVQADWEAMKEQHRRYRTGEATQEEEEEAIQNGDRYLVAAMAKRPLSLDGGHKEAILKAAWRTEPVVVDGVIVSPRSVAVKNLSSSSPETAEWVREQEGGLSELLVYNPKATTLDDLDDALDGRQKVSVDRRDTALQGTITRWGTPKSKLLEYAGRPDIDDLRKSSLTLSRHEDKEVRMEYAKNPSATKANLVRMWQKDRSKHVKEQAHKTLLEIHGGKEGLSMALREMSGY